MMFVIGSTGISIMAEQKNTIAPPVGITLFERLTQWPRPVGMRYGVAIALVIAAFLLRVGLFGALDNRLPFTFFLPAAMLAGWYGGLGPGLLAAGIGLLLGDYFFLPPHQAWGPLGQAERTGIALYAINSTLAVILLDNLHDRIRRLECKRTQPDQ
jgi:K+-sensing histidine kinase KdpD